MAHSRSPSPRAACATTGLRDGDFVEITSRRGKAMAQCREGTFARLGEEIRAVTHAGLAFEIVPGGVTAATGAAALAGIPLTERGTTSMVVLATGTDHSGRLTANLDWELLARLDATLVFYMAVCGLAAITAALTARGRNPRAPAIVVERAGTHGERIVPGRLGDIAVTARAARVESPAVLITGATAEAVSVAFRLRAVRTAADRSDQEGCGAPSDTSPVPVAGAEPALEGAGR